MADAARPAWVDDELFGFEGGFVDIDGHTVPGYLPEEYADAVTGFVAANRDWFFVPAGRWKSRGES